MIDQIKAEIERLIKQTELRRGEASADGARETLYWLKDFIESLEKEQEPKGYDKAYLQEKIDLATKNGSWRESPEKEQDTAKDLQWAAMEYASKAALLSSSSGWRTSDITDAYKAGYEHGCRHAAVLYDDMEKEKQRRCEEEKSEIPIIRGWVARDIHGTLRLYGNDAADGMGIRTGELPSPYKELTAEDEPIEVELTISRVIK